MHKISLALLLFRNCNDLDSNFHLPGVLKILSRTQTSPLLLRGILMSFLIKTLIYGRDGNKKRKDSVRYVEDVIIKHDLVDIHVWRIRNPTDTRFTWRQKSPLIQRRLDYLLISIDCTRRR